MGDRLGHLRAKALGQDRATSKLFMNKRGDLTGDRRLNTALYRLSGIALLLLGWELVIGQIDPTMSIRHVWGAVVGYLPSSEVRLSIGASLRRIGIGFVVGSSLGMAAGVVIGLSAGIRSVLDPLWGFLRPMSPLAWVPLAIVWFGITEQAAVFIIAYASFFPVMLNIAAGVQDVEPVYREAAITLGAGRLDVVRYVMLPATFPYLLAGLRISLGLSWAVIVAAELVIGSVLQAGIGYLMLRYTLVLYSLPRVVALVVLVGTLAFTVDWLMRHAAHRMTPWRTA